MLCCLDRNDCCAISASESAVLRNSSTCAGVQWTSAGAATSATASAWPSNTGKLALGIAPAALARWWPRSVGIPRSLGGFSIPAPLFWARLAKKCSWARSAYARAEVARSCSGVSTRLSWASVVCAASCCRSSVGNPEPSKPPGLSAQVASPRHRVRLARKCWRALSAEGRAEATRSCCAATDASTARLKAPLTGSVPKPRADVSSKLRMGVCS
mmetsp:Transcript_47037/g.118488  ORF Transcript_47037/g.118488 Transcript_47037/m.118488 type:complete len:214 (+) Transcript_47037:135-776(+)